MKRVAIDLPRIAANARAIRDQTGVPVHAVLKANAYGLGAHAIARALADIVDGFYVFDLAEALAADLSSLGRPIIALDHPWHPHPPAAYRDAQVTPIICSPARAAALRDLPGHLSPILSIDTGMRRFGCDPADIPAALAAAPISRAFTHATRLEQVHRLIALTAGHGLSLQGAGSALLPHPEAWLDGVRPGLALYRDAVRITTQLIETNARHGPAGYSAFSAGQVGTIPLGYAHGLRPGPCAIAGHPHDIREVGMQTSLLVIDPDAPPVQLGDEVELVGPAVPLPALAAAWRASQQEVLVRLAPSHPPPNASVR